MAYQGLNAFTADGLIRLAPNDPDAAGLMARYPGRYRISTPEEAAPYIVQLGREGNPFTVTAPVESTAASAYAQSYLTGVSLREAAAAGEGSPLVGIPTSSGISNIGLVAGIGATAAAFPYEETSPHANPAFLAALKGYAETAYGSVDLGITRFSSAALVNGKSGIRMGQMERIVVPAWANREGKPF